MRCAATNRRKGNRSSTISSIDIRISERLDVEFEKDILDQIAGRATMITWMERPARLNSQATLIGVKLKDSGTFKKNDQLLLVFLHLVD